MTDTERMALFLERRYLEKSGLSQGLFAELAVVHRNTVYVFLRTKQFQMASVLTGC